MTALKTLILALSLGSTGLAPPAAWSAERPDSIALAREIIQLSHRQALVRDAYVKQLHTASLTYCRGVQRCQADLDRAIAGAANEVAEKYGDDFAHILVHSLTPSQMRAMLKFYRSPDGRAIIAAQDAASDELARFGAEAMQIADRSLRQNFCPAHPEVCGPVGRTPASPPKP
jgi:hypothetical protein